MNKAFLLLVLTGVGLSALTTACFPEKDDPDVESPALKVETVSGYTFQFLPGENFMLKYTATDNENVKSTDFSIFPVADYTANRFVPFTRALKGKTATDSVNIAIPADAEVGRYRLTATAVDKEGNRSEPVIIPFEVFKLDLEYLRIAPNPSAGIFSIQFDSETAQSCTVRVRDFRTAQTIFTQSYEIRRGRNNIEMNIAEPGEYVLTLTQNGRAKEARFAVY